MKVLIVGASGLVGSHCLNLLKSRSIDCLGTHFNYATKNTVYFNPSSSNYFSDILAFNFKPNIIFHCGALTNVDYCELHPDESYSSTVQSVINLVNYCKVNNCKLVYLSTDYVFDGHGGPYRESDAANPINIYGKHKLLAEQCIVSLDSYLIARITNVYGEEERAKNFIERLLIWLDKNEVKDLKLPNDQFATPVYAGDIARMLVHLLNDDKLGIYHLSSTDYYTRYQLATKIKSYFPYNNSLRISCFDTETLGQTANRPLNGGLLNNKFISEYPDFIFTNVDGYIQNSF